MKGRTCYRCGLHMSRGWFNLEMRGGSTIFLCEPCHIEYMRAPYNDGNKVLNELRRDDDA